MAACMQVMKSLLDSVDRQERVDLKRQRKQETSDERLKRVSRQRMDSVLQRHKDNLRKDILKKRSLLEREIANEIHAEISAALAARYNRNSASLSAAAVTPGRKRKANPVPAAAAGASSPVKSPHRDTDAAGRKRKPKASAAARYQSKTSADSTLYCLCKTPYDESKFYIGCDRCDDWYHGSCVGVTKSEADRMDTYVCPVCRQKEATLRGRDADAAFMPLQERHWLELRRIVTNLQMHKMCWPFLEPVDASEVPDYYIVIKEPMDLQTIRSKVEFREYMSVNDFVKDVTKMFDNCRYYNAPNTPFYRCAEVLEIYFVEKLKSLKAKL